MKILSVAGDLLVILRSGQETGGGYTIMEATIPPGGGPPPHIHSREDETFQVLSGEITFFLGDKTIPMHQGDFIFAPRKIPHSFKNTGQEQAVLLETASPAGIELFFEAVGRLLPEREAEAISLTPEDIQRMRALAPRFGIEILPGLPEARL